MTGPKDSAEQNDAWKHGEVEPLRPGSFGEPPAVPPGQNSVQRPYESGYGGAPSNITRSRIEVSTAVLLLSALPWLFCSFCVVSWVAGLLGFGWAWVIVVVWFASGALVFLRPVEDILSRYLFRLRQPTLVEEQRLGPIWHQATARAGVRGERYALWIQESDDVNALPTPGHVVGVTRWALYTLPPTQLEAVLAHELGHHLGGRDWVTLLSFWYSIPARFALIGLRGIGRLMKAVPAVGCAVVAFVVLAYLGLLLAVLVFDDSIILPLLFLTPFVAPPMLVWLSRRDVIRADRRAAQLGYGPMLIQVLYGWQFQHQQTLGRGSNRRSHLMSISPSLTERVRALEKLQQPS